MTMSSIQTPAAGAIRSQAGGPGIFGAVIVFFESVQAASRVSSAVRNRQQPDRRDLERLGIAPDAFRHV